MSKSVECLNCGEDFESDDDCEGFWVSKGDVAEIVEAVEAGEEGDLIGELLTENGIFSYRCEECGYVFGNGDDQ